MRISVILAHPEKSSFNHALASAVIDTLVQGDHEVIFHDLYAEEFDPLLPGSEIQRNADLVEQVKIHCNEIVSADGIVIVHPNWWGQPPAILKGWVDRVIRPGVAYEFLEGDDGGGIPNGLLNAKAVVVLNTSNTETSREINVFGDPLETIWKNCIFGLCGIDNFTRKMFNIVVESSEELRKQWLIEAQQIITEVFLKN